MLRIRKRALLRQHFRDTLCRRGAHRDHDEHDGQHHQRHQDVHAVGEEAHQLTRRKAVLHDHMRAEPGDEENAGIDRRRHERRNDNHVLLGLHKELVNVQRGLPEAAVFVLLADIGLDYADGADIFLDAFVKGIIFFKYFTEELRRFSHDKEKTYREKYHRSQIDGRDPRVDEKCHRHRHDNRDRRAYKHAKKHLIGILDIRDVRRKTGHKS